MKNIVKTTALSLVLGLTSTLAMAEENIAFINSAYLFDKHPVRAEIAKSLDAKFKADADKLAANKKAIDNKIAALQKEAPKLRSADIKKREDEINGLIKAHDQNVQKFQEITQQAELEERVKLLESIQTATNNIAKEKGYTYVIDSSAVVFAVDGKDITDDVLKAVGGKVEAPAKAEPAKETAK